LPYVLLADFDGTHVVLAVMCLRSLSMFRGLLNSFRGSFFLSFFQKERWNIFGSCDLVLRGQDIVDLVKPQ
jgi:hypothetical protein